MLLIRTIFNLHCLVLMDDQEERPEGLPAFLFISFERTWFPEGWKRKNDGKKEECMEIFNWKEERVPYCDVPSCSLVLFPSFGLWDLRSRLFWAVQHGLFPFLLGFPLGPFLTNGQYTCQIFHYVFTKLSHDLVP